MKSVIRPRNYRGGKPKSTWSHRSQMFDDFGTMKLNEYIDTIPEIPDELKDTLSRNYRMLERGTGKLRKCTTCGRIAIVSKKLRIGQRLKRDYYCVFCNIDKWGGDRLRPGFDYKKEKKESDKLQPAYQKMWEEYLKQINRGVTITKL
jgi:hypothetical protein